MSQKLNKLSHDIKKNSYTFETFIELINNSNCNSNWQGGIYKSTYIKNDKFIYIGRTIDFKRRWNEHENDLLKSIHCGKFQKFYDQNKCDISDFEWSIIKTLPDDIELQKAWEKYYILQYYNDNYHILLNSQIPRK